MQISLHITMQTTLLASHAKFFAMKTIGQQVAEFMERRKFKPRDMAEHVQKQKGGDAVKRQHIESLLRDSVELPRYVDALALAMGVTVDNLINGRFSAANELSPSDPTYNLPEGQRPAILRYAYRAGVVQGGDNGFIEEFASTPSAHYPEPIAYAATKHDEQAYAVKVRGNSMEPTIMAGWDVVASPCRPAEPPDLCVVHFACGRKALKRLLWVRDGFLCLESINATHQKITEPVENITRLDKVISIVPN